MKTHTGQVGFFEAKIGDVVECWMGHGHPEIHIAIENRAYVFDEKHKQIDAIFSGGSKILRFQRIGEDNSLWKRIE